MKKEEEYEGRAKMGMTCMITEEMPEVEKKRKRNEYGTKEMSEVGELKE